MQGSIRDPRLGHLRIDNPLTPAGVASGAAAEAGASVATSALAEPAIDWAKARRQRRGERPPLFDLLVPMDPLRCLAAEIPVPGGTTIAAGSSAWYGLSRITVGKDVPHDLGLNGYHVELLPCDVDGNSTYDAWGDTASVGAALVIGRNLPIEEGGWRSAPAFIAGIEAAGAPLLQAHAPAYDAVLHFPPGKFSDASPTRLYASPPWGVKITRYPRGSTLDVALVVRGSYIIAAGAGVKNLIRLHADVTLHALRADILEQWSL